MPNYFVFCYVGVCVCVCVCLLEISVILLYLCCSGFTVDFCDVKITL